jgi:hypothetical protein
VGSMGSTRQCLHYAPDQYWVFLPGVLHPAALPWIPVGRDGTVGHVDARQGYSREACWTSGSLIAPVSPNPRLEPTRALAR